MVSTLLRKMILGLLCTWLIANQGLTVSGAEKEFFFKPKDKIVFLGDSITEQYQYSSYIEFYLTTRFPNWQLTFLNAGISGDTANGGANRFQSHILDEKPTCVTIDFGMNDGGYGKFDKNRNKVFIEKTKAMLEMAKKAGVRVALISPNAVDRRYKSNGAEYLETQKEFYAPLKQLAEEFNLPYADQYTMTRKEFEMIEKANLPKVRPFGDGFHTSPPGGIMMAHSILTLLNAPALVSSVKINLEGKSIKADQAEVTETEYGNNSVSFTRKDNCLPLWVFPDAQTLLPFINNLDDLNRYELQVSGLASGKYSILIDDKEVAQYSAEELAKGVNLGNIDKGPIVDQAKAVFNAINKKNGKVHYRFRQVVMFNPNLPDWLSDLSGEIQKRKKVQLDKILLEIAKEQEEIYKMVQPKPHKFKVVAVK